MAEYLRIGEVAQAVGVSVDTLRRWEANGTVEFERRGNQRVLRADKLAERLGMTVVEGDPAFNLAGLQRTLESDSKTRFTFVPFQWKKSARTIRLAG